jgi:hypothetical protein
MDAPPVVRARSTCRRRAGCRSLNAAGISIAVVGITISLVLVIGGGLLFLVTRGAVDTRAASREFDQLPGEHGHH